MGAITLTGQAEEYLRKLAAHRGVSEERALGDALLHALEEVVTHDRSEEWRREAMEAIEQYKASIPPEERAERERQAAEFLEVVHGIQERVAAMPVLDPRSGEEIERDLYDEDGLPR